ncbi:MFS transporter [Corynebacterium glucuronolyticum]|uniref:MFS transporter n=1 Tax=Corynebacterium glucuronolyticum TaxID=39791 RepID=UPI003F6E2CFE
MNGRGKTRIALAYTISGAGDSIIPASFAIQSYRLDESGRLLTIVLLSLWLGRLLSSIAAQRMPAPTFPARWMILSDIVRMLAQLLLLWWVVAQSSHFAAAFFVSCLTYGLATAFFNPARFELISIVCETENEKVKLNSLLSAVGDVLFVCGPLLGTFITVHASFEVALVVDAASFAVSILILASFWPLTRGTHRAPEEESYAKEKLPAWVNPGLATWFVLSASIGFLGTAAPTLVMQHFDERMWGWVAAGAAVGSLAGSAGSVVMRFPFRYKQALALVLSAVYVIFLMWAPSVALIVAAAALSSALTTMAGIAWDVAGQSFDSAGLVHQFATKDQLVNTAAIPTGMVIFGIATAILLPVSVALAIILSIVGVSYALNWGHAAGNEPTRSLT